MKSHRYGIVRDPPVVLCAQRILLKTALILNVVMRIFTRLSMKSVVNSMCLHKTIVCIQYDVRSHSYDFILDPDYCVVRYLYPV